MAVLIVVVGRQVCYLKAGFIGAVGIQVDYLNGRIYRCCWYTGGLS